ncbi:MAG TPA: carboxypeptidase-like regulatory domain-containing protein [Mucilaginibacter sp.]
MFFKKIFSLTFFLFFLSVVFAQTTIVKGTVTDALNKQAIPGANITFKGTVTGVTTNSRGKYIISTDRPYRQVKVSILGYTDSFSTIEPGKEQVLNISLFPMSQQLNEVEVRSGKKQKYSNKDNPAVELIRKVIENKEKKRPESYAFVEYREYDKIQFSLNNFPDKLADKLLHKYKFIFDNRDSTTVPGKSLLPIFLDEKLSQYYYRKNPEKEKIIVLGEKTVNLSGDIDNEGIGQYLKYISNKVDIYSNSIFLMGSNFLNPIARNAPVFYKYFITDTITLNNIKLVKFSGRIVNDIPAGYHS